MMAVLRIRTIGDPVLREESRKIENIGDEIIRLAESMIETMRVYRGIGLAAPQVGESVSLVVVPSREDWEEAESVAIVNPVLSRLKGSIMGEEGCLSVPGFSENVKRSEHCVLTGQDLDGNEMRIEAQDFLARVFQHEVDHLKGVLYVDRLSPLKRQFVLKSIQRELKDRE